MRKLLVLSIIVFFFFSPLKIAHGQDSSGTPSATTSPEVFDYAKAYKDYVFMLDQYNRNHEEYLLARAQYLQAQTLASQTKAREATAAMLVSRDDVMMTYLTTLRMKLTDTSEMSDITRNGLFTRLDAEVAWWKGHKGRISSAGTLADLTKDSEEGATRFKLTEPLALEVLSQIGIARSGALRTNAVDILGQVKNKTAIIRANGDHDVNRAERWIIETENKLTRALDKELEATDIIRVFQTTDRQETKSKGESYNTVVFRLEESIQFLREASNYFKEVVKSLKTKLS